MWGISSADKLSAEVTGGIEDVDGVLKITRIRLRYHLEGAAEAREKVDRVLDVYAEKCPAYQSVKGCIDCTWELVE